MKYFKMCLVSGGKKEIEDSDFSSSGFEVPNNLVVGLEHPPNGLSHHGCYPPSLFIPYHANRLHKVPMKNCLKNAFCKEVKFSRTL